MTSVGALGASPTPDIGEYKHTYISIHVNTHTYIHTSASLKEKPFSIRTAAAYGYFC